MGKVARYRKKKSTVDEWGLHDGGSHRARPGKMEKSRKKSNANIWDLPPDKSEIDYT